MSELFQTTDFSNEFGTIRIENWPEGIVLWVGGKIKWKSWSDVDFLCTRLSERRRAADEIRRILDSI